MTSDHDSSDAILVEATPPEAPPEASMDSSSGISGLSERRLAGLLTANRSIVSELSLQAVLQRIVEAAREVANARYAALGVIGAGGGLEQFVHVGMDPDTVREIGDLPRGCGVLGALIHDPVPIRIDEIATDPRSSGFPAHHPPMASFLGVPIQAHGEIFGNLYLTDRRDLDTFTEDDEQLVLAIAATASIAIENARLYEDSRRRQEWLRASAEIGSDLLAADDDEQALLTRIAECVQQLADADLVTIVVPRTSEGAADHADPDVSLRGTGQPNVATLSNVLGSSEELIDLEVVVAAGARARMQRGRRYRAKGSLGWEAMGSGHGIVAPGTTASASDPVDAVPRSDLGGSEMGCVMACPLPGHDGPRGAIVVGRQRDRRPFDAIDLDMASAFANHAAVALQLADRQAFRARVGLLEERDRIARDLHDHVIQRLFATGLTVQSASTQVTDSQVAGRLATSVNDLDDTIRQIRASIFQLQDASDASRSTVRSAVSAIARQLTPVLGFAPQVSYVGPVDTLVGRDLLGDVEAVVREALTNVAKHADATLATVDVLAGKEHLLVVVRDNGIHLPAFGRQSGLANLHGRARERQGTMTITHDQEGTVLKWSVPIPE